MTDRQAQILRLEYPNELPEELIIDEIFKRLPAKALVRFKCVSKRWKSIISSPQFAKLHLQFQRSFADQNQCLLISEGLFETTLLIFDYSRYDNGEIVPFYGSDRTSDDSQIYDNAQTKEGLAKLELGTAFSDASQIYLVGCVDGLVCLASKHDLFLWNPAIQELRKIPDSTPLVEDQTAWAFGYVSSLDDYKIVGYCYDFEVPTKKAQTWTLRNAKWGKVILHEGYLMDSGNHPAVIVDERVFWIMYVDYGVWCIVGFDLSDESFEEVRVPAWMATLEDVDVFAMGRWLGVHGTCEKGGVEIGMLKHYGDWDSWTKLCKIDGDSFAVDRFDSENYKLSYYLCGLTRSGKFLMIHDDESIFLVDTNQNPPTFVKILRINSYIETVAYSESLISPFSQRGIRDDRICNAPL